MWVVIIVRRVICPFCDAVFQVPEHTTNGAARDWLEICHLPEHANDLITAASEPEPRNCSRCQRYAASAMGPSDPLHRRCFEPDCTCRCSYPEKESETCR